MHARSLTAQRRQRILRSRAEPADTSDRPPNEDSARLMEHIDAMPRRWRDLVREYGYVIVVALRADGLSADEASDVLWLRRAQKQAEWLSTDFFLPREMRV